MIAVLACRCGSSLPKARKFLQGSGIENWMETPVQLGREAALQFLTNFSDDTDSEPSLAALRAFIRNSARFIVILGYDGEKAEWSDISHGSMQGKVDAELIVERFA